MKESERKDLVDSIIYFVKFLKVCLALQLEQTIAFFSEIDTIHPIIIVAIIQSLVHRTNTHLVSTLLKNLS